VRTISSQRRFDALLPHFHQTHLKTADHNIQNPQPNLATSKKMYAYQQFTFYRLRHRKRISKYLSQKPVSDSKNKI
jgi:hypothetical protein